VDTGPLRAGDPVVVDGYRLVSRLGTGGMADVYYAFAPNGRQVVVKILRAGTRALPTCRREYELASAVDPRCTAPALGYGLSVSGPYLVMAHLPGYRSCAHTPSDRLRSAVQLWALGSALARTLTAVHAHGIVHCDVKPSNLLVRGGDVRLIDFGIARYVGERTIEDGTVQCTRGWAAPEQLRSGPASPAVDIFAWGCVLAYLATGGHHPFASQSGEEWILRIQSTEPDLFGVPAALHEVIRWTLARNPADRPTADDLATICRARRQSPIRSEPASPQGAKENRPVRAAARSPTPTVVYPSLRDFGHRRLRPRSSPSDAIEHTSSARSAHHAFKPGLRSSSLN
jgi:serine/threonine protein kinase